MAQKMIWDVAAMEHQMRESGRGNAQKERVLLVVGNKNAGKSTLMMRFFERTEERKPTTGLEYTYFRKSTAQNMGKDLAHIWELGGGSSLSELIEIAVKPSNIANLSVVMVLDLSQPNELWVTFEELMTKLQETVTAITSQFKQHQSREALQTLHYNAWAKFGKNHPDAELLNPLQVPIAIIGNKYDLFRKQLDTEKQVICSTLRFLAHVNGASLLFCSNVSEGLVLRARTLLSSLAFGTQQSRAVLLDSDKPLIIPAGADSLGAIGPPPMPDSSVKIRAKKPVELWKHAFSAFFPQAAPPGDAKDEGPDVEPQYAELVVDQMRKQKDQELVKYKQATERAAKEQERLAQASGARPVAETASPLSQSGTKKPAAGQDAPRGRVGGSRRKRG